MRIFYQAVIGVFLLVVVAGTIACGAAATADFVVPSSITLKHSHEVIISGANVDNPPAASVIITSSSNGSPAHVHTITLTPQNYQDIKNSKTVVVTSSAAADGHTHTFSITKPLVDTQTPY